MPAKTPEEMKIKPKEKSLFEKIKDKFKEYFEDTNLTFLGKLFVTAIFVSLADTGLMILASIIRGCVDFIVALFGKDVHLEFPGFGVTAIILIGLAIFIAITGIVEAVNIYSGEDSILQKENN